MESTLILRGCQRSRLMALYRGTTDPAVRLRAHLLLLLADGHPWSLITVVLFCSTATIARWKARFESGGVAAILQEDRGRPRRLVGWAAVVLLWLECHRPRDFGYLRSRWCCRTLALVLYDRHGVKACDETVRRWLHAAGKVWRRPRPTLGRKDWRKHEKLALIRALLANLAANEAAVFSDEVDLNTNPKIGCMWMSKGKQAQVLTPGDNTKRYLAGSMSFRTGELIVTQGEKRNAKLFIAHLEDLRKRLRHYKVIYVICDNARFHTIKGSKELAAYLQEHGDRIQLIYLPLYAPETNPIERVWWHLHDEVTRNHRCTSIQELLDLVMAWLVDHGPFEIETRLYAMLKKAA